MTRSRPRLLLLAMLLALLMITHWLAAITLVPSVFAIVRPKFVERGAEGATAEVSVGEAAAEMSSSMRSAQT